MASVSNAFDALQDASFTSSSKKKKRKGKKSQTATSESGVEGEGTPAAATPSRLPSSHDLESQAAAAISHDARLALWTLWATQLRDEATQHHAHYVDEHGKPAHLRTALLASRALEALVESCLDRPATGEETKILEQLLAAVLSFLGEDAVRQLTTAVTKVSSLGHGKGAEVEFAAKRALRDVMTAVKKSEISGSDGSQSQWKKKTAAKAEKSTPVRKNVRNDRKAEVHEAMEMVKSKQTSIDEMDDDVIGGGSSVARSVTDLQVAFSLASKPAVEEMPLSSKKGKKNKNKTAPTVSSPMLDSLKHEEAAHLAEEERLNEEISNLEMKLKSLRSQLASLHVTRRQVQQRQEALLQGHMTNPTSANGAVKMSVEEQNDAIECLEAVVAQLQSSTGQSEEQKRESATEYIESLKSFFTVCIARQDDLTKTVQFLKDSIHRRAEQEERMKEISSTSLKEILKTQKQSKHELEQQLKDAVFDAGDLLIKVTRVDTDLKHRSDFLRKRIPPGVLEDLENTFSQIRYTHQEIKRIAEEKREVTVAVAEKEQEQEPTRKKVDTKEIIKEAEAKAREEISAKTQPRPRTSPTPSQEETSKTPPPANIIVASRSSVQPRPPVASHVPSGYMPPGTEPVYAPHPVMNPPVYAPHPAHYGQHPEMPPHEVYYPAMHGGTYPPAMNPAGPVQRPHHYDAPPPPNSMPVASGSTKRMAWKKIGGDQSQGVDENASELPTPGEARKQGML